MPAARGARRGARIGADHSDCRGELAFADIGGTVETFDRAAGTEGKGLPLTW